MDFLWDSNIEPATNPPPDDGDAPNGSVGPLTTDGSNSALAGFVDGNFASGKLLDLRIESKCWAVSYMKPLLAVGTKTSLQFYDSSNFALVHESPVNEIISALKWIVPSNDVKTSGNDGSMLIATTSLNGRLCLYAVDLEILESQGPSLLYSSKNVGGVQIRSLDAGFGRYAGRSLLLLAAGDKSGAIMTATFTTQDGQPPHLLQERTLAVSTSESGARPAKEDSILGLAICTQQGFLATSTKGGLVQVHNLAHRLFAESQQHSSEPLWFMQRNGPVRCVAFSESDSDLLVFGGYDKTVVLVTTGLWAVARELTLQGTVNTIEFDPKGRYIGIGCRDKTFTLFDTSTYVAIKVMPTPSWVTSISWWESGDIVAIRSDNDCVSILDLTPIQSTNIVLSSAESSASSVSWSRSGQFLARADGSVVAIADSTTSSFQCIASFEAGKDSVISTVSFCPALQKEDLVAAATDIGQVFVLRLHLATPTGASLVPLKSVHVEAHLNALAWSPDGAMLATGGRGKRLHVYSSSDLKPKVNPIVFQGRVWDVDFVPEAVAGGKTDGVNSSDPLLLAVALGDYTTILLGASFEPLLQISRSRTCRCLRFHPSQSILAIGDGADTVAIVDFVEGDLLVELVFEGRVNDLDFSPVGDYLIAATDTCNFSMYETSGYCLVQEIPAGVALHASFSPNGKYLALGSSSTSYTIMRLGPFLDLNLLPLNLKDGLDSLPSWALNEALYRSGDGPSFFQRQMSTCSGSENLRRVSAILREHPNAVYTFDRKSEEGCFETVLRVQKPALLKVAMINLVNGTLDPTSDREKNFLATSIPQKCRNALIDVIENYPSDYIVDILDQMTFMRVPYTEARVVPSGNQLECGSKAYSDPWFKAHEGGRRQPEKTTSSKLVTRRKTLRTPAVLPLPGLGDMDFLASLLANAPQEAFANDALGVVLRVLWKTHIRKYYYFDCGLFLLSYVNWVVLVEATEGSTQSIEVNETETATFLIFVAVAFNTLFTTKELVEGRYGRRPSYWRSHWNIFDVLCILCVYSYTGVLILTGDSIPPLAVVTTLLLTVKLLSYLRGFSETSWLISVLTANFRDVRGFLIILAAILSGYSVAFRVLFGVTGDESFGSLRRSFLSTFELTILGSYDPALLFETQFTALTVVIFILAVTCVLVVALNALISILADSYARVQENAVANQRRELASLCVEYMSLLPPWKRRQIERRTKWFHTLLEVDADGSLQLQTDAWVGGLNALRHDLAEMSRENKESYDKALQHVKTDLESDIGKFKKEVVTMLEDLVDEVKILRKAQSQGLLHFDAKQNVVKAVKAVKSVGRKGGALFKSGSDKQIS